MSIIQKFNNRIKTIFFIVYITDLKGTDMYLYDNFGTWPSSDKALIEFK